LAAELFQKPGLIILLALISPKYAEQNLIPDQIYYTIIRFTVITTQKYVRENEIFTLPDENHFRPDTYFPSNACELYDFVVLVQQMVHG
jgi:hypothetical protein